MNTPRKVSDLQSAATDCDLIARLSPSKSVRTSNKRLSDLYAKAANDLAHPDLAACEQRIARGKELVALQRGIIARLESIGLPTEQSRSLLATLEETLALFEEHRDLHVLRKPKT